uniref:Uncharacterized protein n=1 Tax=Caenorhabditis japonica TaxID=281687 RepID=A0A8R1I5M9_CAEJA
MLKYIWNRKSKAIYFRILIYGTFFQLLIMLFIYGNPEETVVKQAPIFRDEDSTNNYMNVCTLPVYDYWHPDVMRIVNHDYTPLYWCDKSLQPFTKLSNGNFSIEGDQDRNCSARCFTGSGDHNITFGEWQKPGPVGDCEFLEAVCWENSQEVYGYIHTQIKPKPPPPENPPKFENAPDVFVFLFDSLSTGQAKRSFPKTLSFLAEKLDTVEFPYINKVGENSWPNGMALWFGKLVEGIDNSRHEGGARIPADWNRTEYCHIPLENFTSIFDDFKSYGYMTQASDDWASQMVNYPDCHGFSNPPVDHYMHPFFMVYEKFGMSMTKEHLTGKMCREQIHTVFEYFQQFVDAYPEWTICSFNRAAHLPTVLPSIFRTKRVIHCFGVNPISRELVDVFRFRQNIVSARLRSKEVQNRYGRQLIGHINKMVKDAGYSSKCEDFEFREVISLVHIGQKNDSKPSHSYEITVMATAPSFAVFHTTLYESSANRNVTYGNIVRLDEYEDTGSCTQNSLFEKLCFCRNLPLSRKLSYRFRKQMSEVEDTFEHYFPYQ